MASFVWEETQKETVSFQKYLTSFPYSKSNLNAKRNYEKVSLN